MIRSTWLLWLLLLVLVVLLGWTFLQLGATTVLVAFAEEQTRVCEEMRRQVTESLALEPPDVKKAVGSLEYAYHYYPSGTKQTKDSRLDRIVERARRSCVREIIEMLRVSTGEDLGDSPDPWIERYNE
jgi:hypothetical protein